MRVPATIVCAALVVGCSPPPTAAIPPSIERAALRVELRQGVVDCENLLPERPVRFLTYERDSHREAYGVYGLHDAKAHMEVPTPLGGDPIAWPDVDARGALVKLLRQTGVTADLAHALVATHDGDWFGAGLRVIFVVSGAAPPNCPTWPVVIAELR